MIKNYPTAPKNYWRYTVTNYSLTDAFKTMLKVFSITHCGRRTFHNYSKSIFQEVGRYNFSEIPVTTSLLAEFDWLPVYGKPVSFQEAVNSR